MSIILKNGTIENGTFQSPFCVFYSLPFLRRSSMRKTAILLILLLIGLEYPQASNNADFAPLVKAFNESKLEFQETKVNGWVKLHKVCDENELISISRSVRGDIGFIEYNSETISSDDSKKIITTGNLQEGYITTTVESVYNEISNNVETMIVVDITQKIQQESINDIGNKLYHCLSKYGDKPYISMSIKSYTDGKMEHLNKQKVLDNIFAGLNAVKIEAISDDNLISISGYTRGLPQYVEDNNGRININIACRYSTLSNRTYFWIGTPVINVEY
jgi:hypothetical protein